MKKIFMNSAGCTENIIDGAIMKNIAESADYTFTDDPQNADLIIFNTCAFKKRQEDLCIKIIKEYQKIKKENAKIVVCGCLVNINRERLDSVFDGTYFAPTELEKFYGIIDLPKPDRIEEAHLIPKDISDQEMFGQRAIIEKIYRFRTLVKDKLNINVLPNFDLLEYIGDEKTFYVRIARGCPNKCAYCAVRFAQGKLVSQPANAILKTIEEGIRQGYNKIFLIATNSSAYGKDIGTNFFDLLEMILKTEGDYEVMIHNYEPFGMLEDPERFFNLFSSPKIHSFYCPINSGSQHILKRMNRGYNIEEVVNMLKTLREKNPKILIRTELIVGYPGESWRDFSKSIRLTSQFKFDQIDIHKYSARPNIKALTLEGQLPFLTKWVRYLIMNLLVFAKIWVRRLRPL